MNPISVLKRSMIACGLTILVTNPLPSENVPPAGDSLQSINVGGVKRVYRLHIPKGYNSAQAVPLVLVLHGRGGDSIGIEKLTRMDAKADAEKFIAVFPDALGQPTVWYAGLSPVGKSDDLGFFRALLDKLESTLNIEKHRIYCCGFSSGAVMSYRLGTEFSDRFAAIGVAAGTVGVKQPDGSVRKIPPPAHPVSIIAFHGKKDAVIYYNGGGVHQDCLSVAESIAFWVRADGCSQSPQRATEQNGNLIIENYNRCQDGHDITLYTFANGTHEWPTLQNNSRFSATDAMWEYFVKHPKP
jgi:polyhydroxybutyrate depolymerase